MNSAPVRTAYDGVVACVPITVPYRRYSTNSAHWWIGRALHDLTRAANIRPKDIDGLVLSSFTTAPDTAVGMTQHLGLSPRWLDYVPMGGASGVLLGAVLDRFFAKYVSINGFTETVLRSPDRGEIMRWPMRLGQRALL